MSCDVGKAREELGMSYDVVEATESLENELCFQSLHLRHSSFPNSPLASPTSQLILQPFFRFSYLTGFSHELCSFSKLSVASPTSQLIPQLFPRFTYVVAHSPSLPLLHLRHSSFSYLTGFSFTSAGEPPMFYHRLSPTHFL